MRSVLFYNFSLINHYWNIKTANINRRFKKIYKEHTMLEFGLYWWKCDRVSASQRDGWPPITCLWNILGPYALWKCAHCIALTAANLAAIGSTTCSRRTGRSAGTESLWPLIGEWYCMRAVNIYLKSAFINLPTSLVAFFIRGGRFVNLLV